MRLLIPHCIALTLFCSGVVFGQSRPANKAGQNAPANRTVEVRLSDGKSATGSFVTIDNQKIVISIAAKHHTFLLKDIAGISFPKIIAKAPVPQTSHCDLTLKDSPAIRGLRLAMTKKEINDRFAEYGKGFQHPLACQRRIIEDGREFYSCDNSFNDYNDYLIRKPVLGFTGIDEIELSFFQDALHSIRVKYSSTQAQFSEEQFKSKIVETLNLPSLGWTSGYRKNTLRCAEFEVSLSSEYMGSVLESTNLLTAQRIAESEELKRKNFKP